MKGNAGTDSSNFLGTTDSVALNFRVNNQKSGRIDPGLFTTFYGYQAGSAVTGVNNTFFGHQTGKAMTTGIENTAMGRGALTNSTDGRFNTAIGYLSQTGTTSGFSNVSVGGGSLQNNTTGVGNTAIGTGAMQSLAGNTGNTNTAVGVFSLSANTTGYDNTAIGVGSLQSNTTGHSNAATGVGALQQNTSGTFNTASGRRALTNVTTGSNNIGMGYQSGSNITTGNNNIVIGYNIAAPSATGSNQMSIGNIIYATGVSGTDSTVSNANVGIGTSNPMSKLQINAGQLTGTTTFGRPDIVFPTPALTIAPKDSLTQFIQPNSGIQKVMDLRVGSWFRGQGTGISFNMGFRNYDSRIVNFADIGNSYGTRLQFQTHVPGDSVNYNPGIKIWESGAVSVGYAGDSVDALGLQNQLLVEGNVGVGTRNPENNVILAKGNNLVGKGITLINESTTPSFPFVGVENYTGSTFGNPVLAMSNAAGTKAVPLGLTAAQSDVSQIASYAHDGTSFKQVGNLRWKLSNGTAVDYATYFQLEAAGADGTNRVLMSGGGPSGNVGVGLFGMYDQATNKLHVQATANPLRLQGLVTGSDTDSLLTVSSTGVVRKSGISLAGLDATNDAWVNNAAATRVELGSTSTGTARTAGSEFIVADAGNIAIGQANTLPNIKVQITETGNFEAALNVVNSGTFTRTYGVNGLASPTTSTNSTGTDFSIGVGANNYPNVLSGIQTTAQAIGLNSRVLRGFYSTDAGRLRYLSGASIEYGHSNGNAAATTGTIAGLALTPTTLAGTIDTLFDFNIMPISVGNAATIGSHWSVFNASNAKSYFAANVGIGTTTPAAKLHVQNTGAATGTTSVRLNDIPTYADDAAAAAGGLQSGDVYKTAAANGDLLLKIKM